MSRTSTPASCSFMGMTCGLFSHSAGHEVRTSVWNCPGSAACKSRTAAVSMRMSPGDWKERRINRRMVLLVSELFVVPPSGGGGRRAHYGGAAHEEPPQGGTTN